MATAYLTGIALLITAVASDTSKYMNHTVGGTAGWFFNAATNATSANYSSWAVSQTFNLGDYLLFNTNTNQTVIQTYNETTYHSCITDDSSDNDTFQYGGGSNRFSEAAMIPVPLTIAGPNYYFSDADDGVQCQKGMAFEIVVKKGFGLPPSLNQPPPPPYVAPPSPSDDQSPSVTVATTNQPTGAGWTASTNLHWVVSALLFRAWLLM